MKKDKSVKKLGGHPVVYATKRDGLGPKAWDSLVERFAHAGDEWPLKPNGPFWVVVGNSMDYSFNEMRVFSDEEKAMKYAKAASQGNVDHRVLKVVEATLVIATDNEL